ncbi:NADH:ubiquinone oxidoreductase subunit NDUFA12 [Rhizobium sp. WSM1325]|uniref:NADH:ubiquinone oxidoreductase subunit NDUFA12 n=1 Tax=Rhizobium sp. WSM1325 TaxID=3444086 RepID=UPI001FE11FF6|nr:NADH:ubiquinone oxidoreductase subunit NDUFA12 [Rhizobium leguminosarum]
MFTWWNGQTIGTRYLTWRHSKRVGADEFGNVYYGGGVTSFGVRRRWVIYNGYADAKIPPGWFGWMQNKTDIALSMETYVPRPWQKLHRSNQTGTAQAYRPKGSLNATGRRGHVDGDYEPWVPGD